MFCTIRVFISYVYGIKCTYGTELFQTTVLHICDCRANNYLDR